MYTIDVQIDEAFESQIEVEIIVAAVEESLSHQNIQHAAVTVVILDNEAVQQLNQEYRGIDAVTDVLSFAYQDSLPNVPNDVVIPDALQDELEPYLGDIIIAYPYVVEQAAAYHNSLESELRLLVVHGVLHLLGYDHTASAEEALMGKQQAEILAQFGEQAVSESRLGKAVNGDR